MEQKNVLLGTTVVLLVALAAVLGALYTSTSTGGPAPILTQGSTATEERDILTVSGSGVAGVYPDRVKVQMSIFTEASTAEESSVSNAEMFNKLLKSLEEAGIPKSQIETTSYTIQPIYFYPREGEPKLTGYRTTHMVTVTVVSTETDGLGKIAGRIIDTSVSAGVNRIDSIQFSTSDEKINELRTEALKGAVSDASKKAETIADALKVRLIKVSQVSESVQIPVPRYYGGIAAEAKAAPTELVPGELKVQASVSIVYVIDQ